MKPSFSFIVLIGLVAACSSSKSSSNSSPTGLASGTQMSTLTATQVQNACNSLMAYEAAHAPTATQLRDFACGFLGMTALATGTASDCTAAYNGCMADAGTTTDAGTTSSAGTNPCSALGAIPDCTVTSDVIDSCIASETTAAAAVYSVYANASFCSATTTDAGTTTTDAGNPCSQITVTNCPEFAAMLTSQTP